MATQVHTPGWVMVGGRTEVDGREGSTDRIALIDFARATTSSSSDGSGAASPPANAADGPLVVELRVGTSLISQRQVPLYARYAVELHSNTNCHTLGVSYYSQASRS